MTVAACLPTLGLVAVRFLVEADTSPGLLPRLLQPFAKRDLTPDHLRSRRRDEVLRVEISLRAIPSECVHLIEGNLRQIVGVRSVARCAPRPHRAVA